MKTLQIAGSTIALGLALALTGCGLAKDTKVSEAEVQRFHQRWNENEFQAVFDDAHMNFRSAQPAEKMVGILQGVKRHYGQLTSTKRKSWGFHSDKGITDVTLLRFSLRSRRRGGRVCFPNDGRKGASLGLRHRLA